MNLLPCPTVITNVETNRPIREELSSAKPVLPWLNAALLIGSGILVFRPVAITWSSNANYSFGWWIPLVALFLFTERWPARPSRDIHQGSANLVPLLLVWGLLFFAFRIGAEADPDWRPGLWIIVGLYVAALLGWLWTYGGAGWMRHFAFPVCFLFLSLPWLFEIEQPLVQGLMRWNALMAAFSLQLLGIPAEAAGNIIQLPNCQLGVEEACSGILSLQASVMLGCLLGEIYHLTVPRRLGLVLLTMLFALVGNYGRTLFLALLASFYGTPTVSAWHDTAGYSILIFTGLGSWLASLLLKPSAAHLVVDLAPQPHDESLAPQTHRAWVFAVTLLALTVFTEGVTQGWYGWRESKMPHQPEWTANLPETPTFKPITLLETTQETLMCDFYKAGTWQDAQGWKWTSFWFRYNPKPSNRVVLGWHTPDNCLPSVGLTKDRDYPNFIASVNGLHFLVQPRKFLAKDSLAPIYLFWVIYPTRGELPSVINNNSHAPVTSKFRTHLQDVWEGNRGVGVETLEMAIQGPDRYEDAQSAYLEQLKTLAVPNSSLSPSANAIPQ